MVWPNFNGTRTRISQSTKHKIKRETKIKVIKPGMYEHKDRKEVLVSIQKGTRTSCYQDNKKSLCLNISKSLKNINNNFKEACGASVFP